MRVLVGIVLSAMLLLAALAWADTRVGASSKSDRHRKPFMVATSLVEMDRSAGFTYSNSTNPLSSCPSSGIYA